MTPSRAFRAAIGLLVLALAVQLNVRLEQVARERPPRHSIYLPSGRYLKVASLGFRSLLADLLYVWSIQYYSVERGDRWRHLERLYDAITDLDPEFTTAYSIGALILSLEARHTEGAIRLLDKGIAANPEDWLLPWEAGHYAQDLGRTRDASRYFDLARRRPGAPGFVGRWYAHTLDRAGDVETALAVWDEARRTAASDYERQVAERHIRELVVEIQLGELRRVLDRFRAAEGRWPVALAELVRHGWLQQEPVDAEGNPFAYDPQTGEVEAASGFLFRHRLDRSRR